MSKADACTARARIVWWHPCTKGVTMEKSGRIAARSAARQMRARTAAQARWSDAQEVRYSIDEGVLAFAGMEFR